MTAAGFLAALIPEEYGGGGATIAEASVILEEVNRSGGNAGVCHAQIVYYGGAGKARLGGAAGTVAAAAGRGAVAAAGIWRDRADGRVGHDAYPDAGRSADGDEYVITGQKIWTSRAEYSDLMLLLARTTALEAVTKRTEGLSLFLVDLRGATTSAS